MYRPWRWFLNGALLVAATVAAARAEVLLAAPGVKVIRAGGYCDPVPEKITPPRREGTIEFETNTGGFRFVAKGDRFPTRKGLGIGAAFLMEGYGPGRIMTVKIVPEYGEPTVYEPPVNSEGILEVGYVAAVGEALPPGRYMMSVLDGAKYLATYRFILEAEAFDGLCIPFVS